MALAFTLAVLNGFLNTLLIGAIARFTAKLFASDKAGRLGSFCVALGFAGGRYSYSGPATAEAALAAGALIGAALALVILWAWLLRRAVGQSHANSD